MNIKKLLALLLAAGSVAAFADDTNLYLGVGAGAGWNDVQTPATTFRLDGGYKWNQNWAFEVGTTGITQSGGNPNQGMQYYDASVKGTVNVGDVVGLFLQVGGAYGTPGVGSFSNQDAYANVNQYSQAGWNFLTGVGIDFNLTRRVALNVTDLYYYGAPNPQGATNALLGGVKFSF